ncbi:MAG: hypothetical protein AB7S77_12345 [Desulfatirhabdiaceae bacterium]
MVRYGANNGEIYRKDVPNLIGYLITKINTIRADEQLGVDAFCYRRPFWLCIAHGTGMVLNELSIAPEKTVVVLGLGGIGLSALTESRLLKILGALSVGDGREKAYPLPAAFPKSLS